MSYSKCGLCLKDLEVIRPASGIPYIRCVDWKLCPFFCREDSIHSYQECLFNRVIPEYKVQEGGQLPYCRHMDVATLKVSRSQKNPFRPYFTCRRKEMCRFFQWANELPVDVSDTQSPVYCPKEDVASQLDTTECIPRPKLQRQFAVSENWHSWTLTLIYNIIMIIAFVCKLCLYVINFAVYSLEKVCWYFFYIQQYFLRRKPFEYARVSV